MGGRPLRPRGSGSGRWTLRALALAVLVTAPVVGAFPPGAGPAAEDPTRYVDPFIGTLFGGFVFPGPAAPFGMVQLSPDTDGPFAYTGYQWADASIRGFSHVHVESMGVPSAGDLPFLPTTGPLLSVRPDEYKSPFSHATEAASPGYYRVTLARYGVDVELTAGVRVGMHRYAFPPGASGTVLLDAGRSVRGDHPADVEVVDAQTVAGSAYTEQGYVVHFVARFSRPFDNHGAWSDRDLGPIEGARSASGVGAGAYVAFEPSEDPVVLVKVGISFVRRANALLNLEAELPGDDFDFEALRERTRAAWEDALRSIEVRGGTQAERRSFYTALYHAQHHPNVFTDANGEYVGHDGRVHVADGYVHYANFSLWDTYRGENQLLALLQPDRYRDMMRSLLAIADQAGRLPQWSLMNALPDYMVGEPAVPTLVDAFCRGLLPPDLVEPAYAWMRRGTLERPRDPEFDRLGFIPHDRDGGGVSVTLEHAIARFALALMASELGRGEDASALLAGASRYRNVFDGDESRFMRPRFSDGGWLAPFRPELPEGYVEGTGWQYTWLVPHDVRGLFDAMGDGAGGDALVLDRLDTFFGTLLATAAPGAVPEAQKTTTFFGAFYAGNQYAPSNEHDLQAPYLHAFAGEPWKTQAIVRGLQALYRATPDGLPGNDDLGTLSAWFVWSALGYYPLIPGAPILVVGSPLFENARLRVPGGSFEVMAPGASLAGRHVQSATLDGVPLHAPWFAGAELRAGGALRFEMGPIPSSWGSGPEASPPSMSREALARFACGGVPR